MAWIQAVKNQPPGPIEQSAWRIVTYRMLGRHEDLPPGKQTTMCEDLLGEPHNAYWYVFRPDRLYPFAPTAWTVESPVLVNGLLCTFDTGGLLSNPPKIVTNPVLNQAKSVSLIADCSRSIDSYPLEVLDWIAAAYGKPSSAGAQEYVAGEVPKWVAEGASARPNPIVVGPPNDAIAWTWEARVPVHMVKAAPLQVARLFLTATERDELLNWLLYSKGHLTLPERTRLAKQLQILTEISDAPVESAMQYCINEAASAASP